MSALRTQQYPGTVLSFFVHWVETMWQPPIKNPEGLLSAPCSAGSAAVHVWISDNREISNNASRNPLPRCARRNEVAARKHVHWNIATPRTTRVRQVSRRLPDLGLMTPRTPRMWGCFTTRLLAAAACAGVFNESARGRRDLLHSAIALTCRWILSDVWMT